jgi:hypothetical protein
MTVTCKVTVIFYSAGVEAVQGKWEQLFGVKKEVVDEKVKKPAKRMFTKKKTIGEKKTTSKRPKAKK